MVLAHDAKLGFFCIDVSNLTTLTELKLHQLCAVINDSKILSCFQSYYLYFSINTDNKKQN